MPGLLDWEDSNPSFPNFDAFTAEAKSASKYHASTPNTTIYKRAESTESSSTSTTATHSSSSALLKPKKRGHRTHYSKRRVSGQPSFDLFGADEELQEAEPQMKWCEVCLKSCNVH